MLAKTYIFSLSYLLLTGTAWSQLAVFGLSTQSKAWYSTTMGQGTVAESRAETVLGSYNTT